jgi:uncharacterized membrane protein YphA (DoxX/SURF4 family)
MNILLWVLQIALAAQFLWHGWIMLFPPAELVDIMNANIVPGLRIFIGVTESLGAIGLIVPGVTRVSPHSLSGLQWVSSSLPVAPRSIT